ncbi:hypothetical protein GGX14DRAFT_600551 [Mycena pura]|uniref:Uncharacterized protein n=1 Tax=Mycena pura TaxID=153505 RepID=A0AAD6URN2_9AGAR|nr:hypothetical protein GGX14DRAFT_600551 [Mycena pura]
MIKSKINLKSSDRRASLLSPLNRQDRRDKLGAGDAEHLIKDLSAGDVSVYWPGRGASKRGTAVGLQSPGRQQCRKGARHSPHSPGLSAVHVAREPWKEPGMSAKGTTAAATDIGRPRGSVRGPLPSPASKSSLPRPPGAPQHLSISPSDSDCASGRITRGAAFREHEDRAQCRRKFKGSVKATHSLVRAPTMGAFAAVEHCERLGLARAPRAHRGRDDSDQGAMRVTLTNQVPRRLRHGHQRRERDRDDEQRRIPAGETYAKNSTITNMCSDLGRVPERRDGRARGVIVSRGRRCAVQTLHSVRGGNVLSSGRPRITRAVLFGGAEGDPFAEFAARSAASLRDLTYSWHYVANVDSDPISVNWFRIMRNLTTVRLRGPPEVFMRALFLALNRSTNPEFLPHLRVLICRRKSFTVDALVLDSLCSRYTPDADADAAVNLQTLRLICDSSFIFEKWTDVGDVAWDGLYDLAMSGMNIYVGTEQQNFLRDWSSP